VETSTHEQIREKLNAVQAKMDAATHAAGRPTGSTRLLVVTKGQSVETIQAAYAAGIRLFGENYPEESLAKIDALSAMPDVEWHMIGHLQSRKARIVAQHFNMLHSLDSLTLAEKLDRQMSDQGRSLPVLLEVNVSGEESKGGWPAWDSPACDNLAADIEKLVCLEHLQIRGLMVMPPLFDDAALARPFFRKTRLLRDWLAGRFPDVSWNELSMGTSADYQEAIEEGSTFVRIGTAILGPRPPRA